MAQPTWSLSAASCSITPIGRWTPQPSWAWTTPFPLCLPTTATGWRSGHELDSPKLLLPGSVRSSTATSTLLASQKKFYPSDNESPIHEANRMQPDTAFPPAKADSTLPLAGLRVIEIGVAMAGPFCAMMLGDYGADVIKIERPGEGDDSRSWPPYFHGSLGYYYASANRN